MPCAILSGRVEIAKQGLTAHSHAHNGVCSTEKVPVSLTHHRPELLLLQGGLRLSSLLNLAHLSYAKLSKQGRDRVMGQSKEVHIFRARDAFKQGLMRKLCDGSRSASSRISEMMLFWLSSGFERTQVVGCAGQI